MTCNNSAVKAHRDGRRNVWPRRAFLLPLTAVVTAAAGVPPIGGDIAFQSSRAGFCCRVYTMDADGSNVQSPLFTMASTFDPAWSPDGSRLAFASFGRRHNFDIYVMDARAGAPARRLNG